MIVAFACPGSEVASGGTEVTSGDFEVTSGGSEMKRAIRSSPRAIPSSIRGRSDTTTSTRGEVSVNLGFLPSLITKDKTYTLYFMYSTLYVRLDHTGRTIPQLYVYSMHFIVHGLLGKRITRNMTLNNDAHHFARFLGLVFIKTRHTPASTLTNAVIALLCRGTVRT
jgi:hypothetical protein